jgi:hypothetical protein
LLNIRGSADQVEAERGQIGEMWLSDDLRRIKSDWVCRDAFPLDPPVSEHAIALTGRSLQHSSIRAERLANRGDVNLQGILPDDRARPYPVHEFLLGDEFTGRLDQNLGDLERTHSYGYKAPAQTQFAPNEIGFPVTTLVDWSRVLCRHRRTSCWTSKAHSRSGGTREFIRSARGSAFTSVRLISFGIQCDATAMSQAPRLLRRYTMIGSEAAEVMAVMRTAMAAEMPCTKLRDIVIAHFIVAESLGLLCHHQNTRRAVQAQHALRNADIKPTSNVRQNNRCGPHLRSACYLQL